MGLAPVFAEHGIDELVVVILGRKFGGPDLGKFFSRIETRSAAMNFQHRPVFPQHQSSLRGPLLSVDVFTELIRRILSSI